MPPLRRPCQSRLLRLFSANSAPNQAALNAAAAQKRVENASCTDTSCVEKPIAAPLDAATPEAPAAPSVDRSVFGTLLKRRRFDGCKSGLPKDVPPDLTSQSKANTTETSASAPPQLAASLVQKRAKSETTPSEGTLDSSRTPPPPPMRCSRCDGRGHTAEHCEAFRYARLDHPGAQLGAAVPHMTGQLNVEIEDHRVACINGNRFYIGNASGEGCNCLIDTLSQLLGAWVPSDFVRRDLMKEFPSGPDRVTEANFLDLRAHWEAIVHSLNRHSTVLRVPVNPRSCRLICADLVFIGQGDIVGAENGVTFYLARVHTNHFVPLIRKLVRSRA